MKKRRILRVAQEMFGRNGYHATTVKMIAEKAQVAFGLVAHHFGTKENLFLAAGLDMVDQVTRAINASPQKTGNGLEAVGQFIQAYLDFTLTSQACFPILIRCSPFSDVDLDFARERIAEKFQDFLLEISRRLKRGMQDGSVRKAPLEDTALLVYGSVVSAVRTRFLTPYDLPGLYPATQEYILQAIRAAPVPEAKSVFGSRSMID